MNGVFGELLLVGLGGGFGAMLRYGAALGVSRFAGPSFAATLLVNVVGCFCMGWLLASPSESFGSSRMRLLLGTGVLGGFTTFSTFAADTQRLATDAGGPAFGYVAASVIGGLVAFWAGRSLGAA